LEQFAGQLRLAATMFNRVVAEIQALPAPPGEMRRVNQLVVAMRANSTMLRRARAAALRRDQKGLEAAVEEGKGPALRAGQLAFELGLTKCSQPMAP
jgi:hypothetical protein